jgi:1-acyl-sn-glycerol-3-phosphate acyltransferase
VSESRRPARRVASILFTSYMFLSVPFFAMAVLVSGLISYPSGYRAALSWVNSVLFMLRRLCGLDYRVEGIEHLPDQPCIVLMKHSSAWETIAQVRIFPRQTWVLKQELLWAPFFGWALKVLRPIGIDRRGGRVAVQQVVSEGRARLAEGLWVVIFPEGTRMPAGQTRRYGLSGALLASETGVPVIPVAHDAGDYWPRRGWWKRPGTVRMVIGPAIETKERDPRAINEQAQTWIEHKVAELRAELPAE